MKLFFCFLFLLQCINSSFILEINPLSGNACLLSCFSHVRLFANPWTVASQAPLLMGFSQQEYWSGLLCPLPGYLPDLEIEPTFPALPPEKPPYQSMICKHFIPCCRLSFHLVNCVLCYREGFLFFFM